MAERIVSLRNSTFALCSTINKHLKASTSTHNHDLKALVVELRLLGGSLYSLEQFILELQGTEEDVSNASGPAKRPSWPAVDGCELLVQALQTLHAMADPDGLKQAKSALIGYRSKFGFILCASESLQDVDLQFSLLGKEPTLRLHRKGQSVDDAQDLSRSGSYAVEEYPRPVILSTWMAILNSPYHDCEPAEYAREMANIQTRRLESPLYRTASLRWPTYAEAHWARLGSQILSLFQKPKPFNFVQWVLEYARETYPRTFGSLAMSPKSLLELTDALCNGSISPLHMAAALGLPSLCKDLLSKGADVNDIGFLGSPLFCAFVGPKVLTTRAEPESWASLLDSDHAGKDRAATIILLLDKGADCGYKYQWKNAEEVSLAGLSLWAALINYHDPIFNITMARGAGLDSAIIQLMQREKFRDPAVASQVSVSRLLTFLFDLTLAPEAEKDPNAEELRETVHLLMKESGIIFAGAQDGQCVPGLGDVRFRFLVRESIVNSDSFLFHRLILDPRFDPDLSFDESQVGGTILHMATEGGHVEIIDSLIKAGASLAATDAEGRTPMMVVEEPPVLSKLILEYGATTTDVDNNGRTIWHLAASTNYAALIKWLRESDPCKQQNLTTRNLLGCTPLDDAFLYISSLRSLPKGWKQTPPVAARTLLADYDTIPPVESTAALLHCAIEWGELDLLDDLIKLGCKPDKSQGPLLRSLNLSASNEMLEKVLELCKDSSLIFDDGASVAETILTNTVLDIRQNDATFAHPTAHPSCYPKLTESAYEKLLTPEVLKSRDSRGRGIWERLCDNVLPMVSGPSCQHPQQLLFLSSFICTALASLNSHGVLEAYEQDTGSWAVLYMADRTGASPSWERWQFPFIPYALDFSTPSGDGPKFVDSTAGLLLLAQAVRRGQASLVELLIAKGVKVHIQRPDLYNKSLLEHLIPDVILIGPILETLLESLEPLSLVNQQHRLFRALLELRRESHSLRILKALLVQKLIDPNQVSTDQPDPRTMLQEAIDERRPDLALVLLDHGADPALTENGDHAILAAAKGGYVDIFNKVVEVAGSDFNWHCYYDVSGERTFNALQVAAANGRPNALSWLLERTSLRFDIDGGSPRNSLAPIHLAVKGGSLSCVRVLDDSGANLEIQDSNGSTPLMLAIRGEHEDIFRYLLDVGVNTELDRYGIHIASSKSRAAAGFISEYVANKLGVTPPEPLRLPDPVKLGSCLADLIEHCHSHSEGVIAKVLTHVPKEFLVSAVLPCRGCTLLSFAGAHGCTHMMLELVEGGFGGFITGCATHWPVGYNVLHHACFGLLRQLDDEEPELIETTIIFIRKCLDAYLAEGILWFLVDSTPLHAIVQFGGVTHGERFEIRERALRVLLNHLEARADEYWKLVEEAGVLQASDYVEGENTATRLKRYVVNIRRSSVDWLAYSGGTLPTALHLLIDGLGPTLEPAEESQRSMIELLISNGIDVDAKDGDSMTALHLACFRGNLAVVKILIEAGADPNVRDDTGASPLSRAIDCSLIEPVRYLIEHGADLTTFTGLPYFLHKSPSSNTAFMKEVSKLGLDWYATSPGNSSIALMMIVETPCTRMTILNGNADIDFARLASERPTLLNLLISRHCTPSQVKKVLKRAPRECHSQILHPDPSASVQPSCLPIRKGDVAMLEMLLKFGWDMEKEISEEGSALMLACSVGQLHVVSLLVRRGARLAYVATNSRGQRVVRSVFRAGRHQKSVIRWLLVGRHQQWNFLEEADDASPDVATKLWSGPRKGAHKLPGLDELYIRPSGNTYKDKLAVLRRVAQIRKKLANKIVHVTLVE